jgi:type VI secretion system secreted protein Hcp
MKRRVSSGVLAAIVVAASLMAPSSALAAVDMFLKITEVTGESKDIAHKDEIDVLAWSWGASSGNARTGKGALPVACIQDLSVTKYIDSASPELILSAALGTVAKEAVLTVRKAGEKPLEYLVIKMSDVLVTSYSTGGSGGEDRLTENVTLSFESLKGEYRKQKADGTGDTAIPFEIAGGVCR